MTVRTATTPLPFLLVAVLVLVPSACAPVGDADADTADAAGTADARGTAATAAAAAIVAQVMDAYGGRDALAGVEALRLDGTIVTHPAEAHGSFIRIVEGGDSLKVLLHYPQRVEIRIVDGDDGYNGSTPQSLSPASGPMLAAMQLQAARSWVPWILDAMEDRLEVERTDPDLTVLAGDLRDGLRLRFFIEGASHHVLRTESEMSTGGMSMVFATDYGDFREVDGILVPYVEESFASGTHTASLVVEQAEINPPEDQRRLPMGG